MSYRDEMAKLPTDISGELIHAPQAAEISAHADARIAELERAVVIRDTEIARLETDLEVARRDVGRMRKIDERWVRMLVHGAASEGQAAKATGLGRIELRKRADDLDALIDKARAGNGGVV